MDIQRFLDGQPIVARPPSRLYRLEKMARRNKVAFAAAGATALALILGFAVATLGFVQAIRAKAKEAQLLHQVQIRAYASDMKAAQVAFEQQNRGMAIELLTRYLPRPGGEDLRGTEWRYLWQESRGEELLSLPHPAMVKGASLSPDGRHVASLATDGKVRVWDMASRKQIQEFAASTRSGFKSIGFSPDGNWLATLGAQAVQVRDTKNWSVVKNLEGTAMLVSFSPDGRYLAAAGAADLRVWDLADWSQRTLTNGPFDFSNLAFTPDGKRIVCCAGGYGDARPIQLWEFAKGTQTSLGDNPYTTSLEVSPDGKWLAAGNWDGQICLWDLPAKKLEQKFRAHRGLVFTLAFSPDGKLLATGGNDQVINFWVAGTSDKVRTLQGHDSEIWSVSYSADGQKLISSSQDGSVKLWSVNAGLARTSRLSLATNSEPIGLLADGSGLVTGDGNAGITRILSLPDGHAMSSFLWTEFDQRGCTDAEFFPELNRAVGVSSNGIVHLWNLRTGSHLQSTQVADRSFFPAVLSQDNCWLQGRLPGHAALFELCSPQAPQALPDHSMQDRGTAFSPDNRWFAYSTTNCDIKLWHLKGGQQKVTLKGPRWNVSALQFSPDGKVLASGDWNGSVWLWSTESGLPLHPALKGHQSGVASVFFSSDAKTLITSGDDKTLRLWNVASGQEMLRFDDVQVVPQWASHYTSWGPEDRLMFWKQFDGQIRVTPLPSLPDIDAALNNERHESD
jgi:WD40 repeat protein